MKVVVGSIRAEFLRYKAMAEGSFRQLDAKELCTRPYDGGNSVAVIAWHVSGNLRSRFTDFLTTDGEKPWRKREEEFAERTVGEAALLEKWEDGWATLLATLDGLTDDDLTRTVTIRQQSLAVHEALHRSLAHVAYHVGQIVFAGRWLKGAEWKFLSIPPGQSASYNQNPQWEKPEAHKDILEARAEK